MLAVNLAGRRFPERFEFVLRAGGDSATLRSIRCLHPETYTAQSWHRLRGCGSPSSALCTAHVSSGEGSSGRAAQSASRAWVLRTRPRPHSPTSSLPYPESFSRRVRSPTSSGRAPARIGRSICEHAMGTSFASISHPWKTPPGSWSHSGSHLMHSKNLLLAKLLQ